jgi:hypothetical protein
MQTSLRANELDEDTFRSLTDAHVDVTGAKVVEVEYKKKVLWVNVNGVCLLRICGIESFAFHKEKP